MASWSGYALIEVTTALSGAQKIKLRDTLLGMGTQDDPQPVNITHIRPRLDNQAAILAVTISAPFSKSDFVNVLAAALGISVATLNANLNASNFAGADWEARRQAVCDYLLANAAAWGENAA